MLDVYVDFVENMAIPVIAKKSENERFPGADNTYCIEAVMQDKKLLFNTMLFRAKFCKSF